MAVLPFVNASADPNTEYLSDGITESLINSLSTLPHLKVMSRDSAFMYKGKDTDARTVGQTLGVRAVLKGRVMQRGDDLEISAELVDARDNSHIWGQQYSRKASDIFALQGDLAKEMTSMLRMRLTGEDEKRMTKSHTTNPEAYQDYLKGRYWWSKTNEEGLNKGIEYFQQAIAKDPTYALAYSGLADSYTLLAVLRVCRPQGGVSESQGRRAEGLGNRRNARRSTRLAGIYRSGIRLRLVWRRRGISASFSAQSRLCIRTRYACHHLERYRTD